MSQLSSCGLAGRDSQLDQGFRRRAGPRVVVLPVVPESGEAPRLEVVEDFTAACGEPVAAIEQLGSKIAKTRAPWPGVDAPKGLETLAPRE